MELLRWAIPFIIGFIIREIYDLIIYLKRRNKNGKPVIKTKTRLVHNFRPQKD